MTGEIVKQPIYAGRAQSKPEHVGTSFIELIYDSPEKDCLIGQREVKRTFFRRFR